MKFFHGTDEASAQRIIKNGFADRPQETLWTCSNNEKLYVVSSKHDDAIRLALNAGQIAAAIKNQQTKKIYIFEFKITDPAISDEFLEEDDSCRNMYHCFTFDSSDLDELIAKGWVQMKYYEFDAYLPMFRPFYVCHLDEKLMELKDEELCKAAKIASSIDCYGVFFEEVYDTCDIPICHYDDDENDEDNFTEEDLERF